MTTNIGMSAVSDKEEKLLLIEDLIHTEQHISQNLEKYPERADELGRELDEVRRTRQKAVKIFSEGKANSDFSCLLKHSASGHLRGIEVLNNTVRISPEKTEDIARLNQRLTHHRDFAVKHFLSGKGKNTCARCVNESYEEDLDDNNDLVMVPNSDNEFNFGKTLLIIGGIIAGIGLIIYIKKQTEQQ